MIISQLGMLTVLLRRQFTATGTRVANAASRRSVAHVRKALEHIGQRYYEPIEIGTLARICNMSLRNFTRRFSEALQRSPHEYIVDTRIAVACGHLLRPDAHISYVADQSGFSSISAFNRTFKQRMGASPREWRKRRARQETPAPTAPPFSRNRKQRQSPPVA
jgi:AraC-like DNA-binding protein